MYFSQGNALPAPTRRVLLLDFEINDTFLKLTRFGDCEANCGVFFIIVLNAVVFDCAFGGAAAVFRGGGGREVPFYQGGAGDEGDVVEVVDGEGEGEAGFARFRDKGHGCCIVVVVVGARVGVEVYVVTSFC